MNALIEKYEHNATLVIRAFAITKRTNRQLQARELTILKQAVDVVVPHLADTCGMTCIEFEILLLHAAVMNPENTVDFLDTAVEFITVIRPESWLTEYDMWFLKFVSQLRNALDVAQNGRQGESSASVSFAADSTLQASVPVLASFNHVFQAWSGNTSQMANPAASILSEPSVASCWNITSSPLFLTNTSVAAYMASSGGAQTPSNMLNPSSTPGAVDNFTGVSFQNWLMEPPEANLATGFEVQPFLTENSYLDSSMGLPETQVPSSLDGFQNDNTPDWLVNSLDYDLAALIASIKETNTGEEASS
ncbi:hypothetical protein FAVG1_02612 [Fusarium avenaceum]|nr:hypothetical protein FAVG1_02612 [Fusarium avenaceum]